MLFNAHFNYLYFVSISLILDPEMRKIKFYLIATAVFLTACASTPAPELTDNQVYANAHTQLTKRNYAEAAIGFEQVDKLHPASPLVADALVLAAYSYYMDSDYAGAIANADRFLRFHPGHKLAAYVIYLKGMSYMQQASDVQRDASMTQSALAAFGLLIERFPNSEYAGNAKNKVAILRNYLAGKMMFLARQDQLQQNWPSAITRLNGLIVSLPDSVMIPEALYRLAASYAALGMKEQVNVQIKLLQHNYPDSEWLDAATGLDLAKQN